MTPAVSTLQGTLVRQRLIDYLALVKPRVVLMVLVTTVVGYYLGSAGPPDIAPLVRTLLGTALAAGGTLALNQFMERDLDGRMERTRRRPLPEGRLLPAEAFVFGLLLVVVGVGYLARTVNTAGVIPGLPAGTARSARPRRSGPSPCVRRAAPAPGRWRVARRR